MGANTETHVAKVDFASSLRPYAGALTHALDGPSAPLVAILENARPLSTRPEYDRAIVLARRIDELGMDAEACLAAFVYAADPDPSVAAEVGEFLGRPAIAQIVQSVVRMNAISRFAPTHANDEPGRPEQLRRMLIGMIDDVRVVVIRLAAQLEYLRSLKAEATASRFDVAQETRDLFAPLANRLGIWQLKWELEDLAFRYMQPERYHGLATKLAERRVDRERFIVTFCAEVSERLGRAGIEADIKGRPKHLYSIFRKMLDKNLDIEHVFDVRAIRLLVNSTRDCYTALGIVHENWSPVAGEFDDYIATPKANGYRSIHTAVVGPGGRVVEVQIRTHAMHVENELGVAAHWRYKEGVSGDQSTNNKVLWLRSLLDWKDEISSTSDFLERLSHEVVEDRLYVFSPNGRVVDLPNGATAVDFAYAIHTEVGHSCRGARVNGRIVPLHRPLETGEQVEILRGRRGGPSRDWIQSTQFVHTSRARARIQRWFKQQHHDENISAGRHALDRELGRLGMSHVAFDRLALEHGYRRVEDFLAAIGCGDVRLSQAVSSLKSELARTTRKQKAEPPRRVHGLPHKRRRGAPRGLDVQGVGNLLTTMASCCTPVPGDAIGGYVSTTRGVTVHREDCDNYLRLRDHEPNRILQVSWGENSDETFIVEIQLFAFDRPGLLRDVSSTLADAGVNVMALDSKTNSVENTVRMTVSIEIDDVQKLSQVLTQMLRVPNVTEARRVAR